MTREEIDIMWQQALQDSVRDGEIFTRYHFAKLVAAKEREACHALRQTLPNTYTHCQVSAHACDMAFVEYGKAIRARAQAERGEA